MKQPMNPDDDITIFADQCVYMRSIYLHRKILFKTSTDEDLDRMHRAASTFFSDLFGMLEDYIILQVCKITDPARDLRKNDNLTIAFLLEHYSSILPSKAVQRLKSLDADLQAFRAKLLPARNKLISHADRSAIRAIRAGQDLGEVRESEWNEFWINLQDAVCIIYQEVCGTPFYINGVSGLSDADGLLKALKHGTCFDQLSKDPTLTQRCADLALS